MKIQLIGKAKSIKILVREKDYKMGMNKSG